jgi:hypothetical protein
MQDFCGPALLLQLLRLNPQPQLELASATVCWLWNVECWCTNDKTDCRSGPWAPLRDLGLTDLDMLQELLPYRG